MHLAARTMTVPAAIPTEHRSAAADVLGAVRAVKAGRHPASTAALNVLRRRGYVESNPSHEPFTDDGQQPWLLTAKGRKFARHF